jgi:hypothetical protein
LTAAAACRDVDAEREDGDGLRTPSFEVMVRVMFGDPEVDLDLEGGREFKSGAIATRFMVWDRLVGQVDGIGGRTPPRCKWNKSEAGRL